MELSGIRISPWIAALNCLLTLGLLVANQWRALPRAPAQRGRTPKVHQVVAHPAATDGHQSANSVRGKRGDVASRSSAPRVAGARPAKPRFSFPANTSGKQLIRMQPPVADRIEFDPSLAETPSLPVPPQPAATPQTPRRATVSESPPTLAAPAPPPARRSAAWTADVASVWPWPAQLALQLEAFQDSSVARQWATQVMSSLRALHAIDSFADRSADEHISRLQQLNQRATQLAADIKQTNARAQLLRANYALGRRLAVWKPIQQLALPPIVPVSRVQTVPTESPSVSAAIAAAEEQLTQVAEADLWRRYLMLDKLAALAADPRSVPDAERSKLAQQILRRTVATSLTDPQRAFFAKPPWPQFARALRQWVSDPVDYRLLLTDLERFEQSADPMAAQRLAQQYQILRWSPAATANGLAGWLNAYYRNANIRISIAGDLINRMLPDMGEMHEPVDDVLLGSRIRGNSRVSTRLQVVLLPDHLRWRLGLEAHGEIDSTTSTKHGPAKFYNAGRGNYLARKLLLVDPFGLRARNAEANASTSASLTRLETDFDSLPLLNVLARSIAKQQYESQSHEVKWRLREKVAARARKRLDEEVDRQVYEFSNTFKTRVYRPLVQLGLQPEAVDMQTTEQRLIARYRLAGDVQLAAFTPRPQAPGDSLLSLQIHESAINNTIGALRMGDEMCSLSQLFINVANKFDIPDFKVPEDIPDDVMIRMAAVEPVRMRFDGDRVHVGLRIARLEADRRVWRNFEVRADYAPAAEGLHTRLVRDGYIKLKGYRLGFGDQLALRGVFSKVLPRNPEFDILGQTLGKNPRMQGLEISQFVMRDGWIGIALHAAPPVQMHLADKSATTTR